MSDCVTVELLLPEVFIYALLKLYHGHTRNTEPTLVENEIFEL